MDITPIIPSDKKVIQAYSEKSFKINDQRYYTNLIVVYDEVIEWNINSFNKLKLEDFEILKAKDIEILIIGCGYNNKNSQIKHQLKDYNVEFMNTGAACRTYNILLAEGRLVAAGLILSQ